MNDFQEFLKSQKEDLQDGKLEDDYKTFLDNNEDRLQDEFSKKHNFTTSVRGLKVRGCYSTQEEAELRCKLLREIDPNHNVYVGPVGLWMPWEPEAYKTGRVEYLEEQLNELIMKKIKMKVELLKNAFLKLEEKLLRKMLKSLKKLVTNSLKILMKKVIL